MAKFGNFVGKKDLELTNEEKYFIVVNETKKEIYFASKNQFRAQHFTKFIYKKYDKHVSCVPRYLTQKEIEEYKDIISKRD